MQDLRKPVAYGDVELPVQASASHHCSPRVDGLMLRKYTAVEIAVLDPIGEMVKPSTVGIKGFDVLFENRANPVAGWVTRRRLSKLRAALRNRAAQEKATA